MAVEGELTRPLDELLRQGRHEDLARAGRVGQPAGHDDRVPEVVVALVHRVAGVDADVDRDGLAVVGRDVGEERPLDVDGAAQGAGHAAEGHHEAVPLDADLASAVAGDGVAHDAVVLAQDLARGLVAQPLGHAGVVDHVAEEDRDGAVGGELVPDVLFHCGQLAQGPGPRWAPPGAARRRPSAWRAACPTGSDDS